MTDLARRVQNMMPPRTLVRYAGLSGPVKAAGAGGGGIGQDGAFGTFIAFRLPRELRRCGAATMLERMGENPGPDAERTLLTLIQRRTRDLPLPDGCAVMRCKPQHACPWPDALAALAVITKSSSNVWLRSKTPRLSAIRGRPAVSLLLPPAFGAGLLESSE